MCVNYYIVTLKIFLKDTSKNNYSKYNLKTISYIYIILDRNNKF